MRTPCFSRSIGGRQQKLFIRRWSVFTRISIYYSAVQANAVWHGTNARPGNIVLISWRWIIRAIVLDSHRAMMFSAQSHRSNVTGRSGQTSESAGKWLLRPGIHRQCRMPCECSSVSFVRSTFSRWLSANICACFNHPSRDCLYEQWLHAREQEATICSPD